ncbi:hypothetical protein B0H13DRAFT_1866202 [Mycena leptocephala]|nr:hypothetical protein B0H13DRAFT_1866202 [Mycena leptocephala]
MLPAVTCTDAEQTERKWAELCQILRSRTAITCTVSDGEQAERKWVEFRQISHTREMPPGARRDVLEDVYADDGCRRCAAVLRLLKPADLSRQWTNTEIFFKQQVIARMLFSTTQTAARFNGHLSKCQVGEQNECRIVVSADVAPGRSRPTLYWLYLMEIF